MTATVPTQSELTTSVAGPQIVLLQRDADDWASLWSTWLRALEDSPDAFVARHAEEAKLPEHAWRERLRGSTWATAWDDGRIVGIAQFVEGSGPDEADIHYIQSVWVEENYRRQGLLRRMVERLEFSAYERGIAQIYLWVLATNPEAEKAYSNLRFVYGGKIQESRKVIGGRSVPETLMVMQVSEKL